MPYQLCQDLSFCKRDGRLLFLDIQHDRYFRLPHEMECAFIDYIDNHEHSSSGFSSLIKNHILVKTSIPEEHLAVPSIKCATFSVFDDRSTSSKFDFPTLLEVGVIVASTKWQLKTRKLKDILEGMNTYRSERKKLLELAQPEPMEQRLLYAASLFRHARAYIPIEPSCLLDSLAMIKFLSRRRLPSSLVFGVTFEPFSAHCWVQFKDWLLNDMIGTTSLYTPIKII